MSSQIKAVPLSFYITPSHDCPYLENQQSKTVFLSPEIPTDTLLYSSLVETGFRRSGAHIYRPHCDHCKACVSVRIPVENFEPNRQQKRCLKKSTSLKIRLEPARFNQKHYSLYDKYISIRHRDGDMYPASPKQYKEFLLSEWLECSYLNIYDINNTQLISACVYDTLIDGLSAVYTYFDPDYHKYSLGKLSILKLIETAKRLSLPYVYLGYWIKDSPKMAYKGEYRPLECFINNQWTYLS